MAKVFNSKTVFDHYYVITILSENKTKLKKNSKLSSNVLSHLSDIVMYIQDHTDQNPVRAQRGPGSW